MDIPARDALKILSLYNFFKGKISKERILQTWKKNQNKSYEELKSILQEELEEAA